MLVLEVMIVESEEENEEEKRGFYSKMLKRKAKLKKYKANKKCRCKSGGLGKFFFGKLPNKGRDQEPAQALPTDNQDNTQGMARRTRTNLKPPTKGTQINNLNDFKTFSNLCPLYKKV
ncbi:uncharacterized protein LOC112573599 [Pomacea canaliculata]|uniref:uncharacterized protein LOC112573599 n=1 Tax=Pomacea canaliculata TaxID=400727 RepID=UPI000D73F3F8|nr:uncharacterized protein LOC112573599 [Pomacea canaliculata]